MDEMIKRILDFWLSDLKWWRMYRGGEWYKIYSDDGTGIEFTYWDRSTNG